MEIQVTNKNTLRNPKEHLRRGIMKGQIKIFEMWAIRAERMAGHYTAGCV